ncbi:hypothetical protein E3Q18_03131 [Wallemia mellicola]|uniref:Ras-domain-containing protein n=1 Tax=Wallemia mellicola TaxID=1708541 RepID=A0A4T0R7Q0_9BASI|nr:hypothetical protein E3Q24_00127 [Wallemia mellicola]TIB89201.1 hypothetical protein E3Q21_00652 [Wallemia mellicola]TIB91687.1 hypothetical protein E3Q20_00638 [Wallemia mellicola]TIB94237.1 hypothetical protein E3Q19_00440 [Wallemia mellicola]TIB96471.1 hypothetical protein E3Q18_03131 [Wallemia mellicola]
MTDTHSVTSISTRNEPLQAFKLLLIGNSSVGKSSLLLRFTENDFLPEEDANATIGVDFKVKYIQIKDKRYKLSICHSFTLAYDRDTAGQERFRSLVSSYYRGAQGVILVYDVTNRETFDKLRVWFQELDTYSTDDAVKIVVGNKTDVNHQRAVSIEEAKELAELHNAMFVECSAKTSTGVNHLFYELAQKIIDTPSLHKPIPKATPAFFDTHTGSVKITEDNAFSRYCSC